MTSLVLEPLSMYRSYPPNEMVARARAFYEDIKCRRTVRDFAEKPVPREVIEYALLAAGTAPSGANLQPWHFTVITDPSVKRAQTVRRDCSGAHRHLRAAVERATRWTQGQELLCAGIGRDRDRVPDRLPPCGRPR